MKALAMYAEQANCRVTTGISMATATTFRIGGPADLLIDIPHAEAAAAVLRFCKAENIPWLWLGNGSNLLVGDRGIRGAVLRWDTRRSAPQLVSENTITAEAGLSLQRLCLFARDNALAGLEFAYGIPGTVGGAVYMNAGAYGGQMADVLVSATCLTAQGEIVHVPDEDLRLDYRHSALMETGAIVAAVTLRLQPGDKEAIAARMKELIAKRQEKQPLEYPSAGSFFKRPTGYFAGALVEQSGLKGYRVGGAQVSEKHAGFVINRENATAADVRRLCADVQEKVRTLHGVSLEPEVQFVGEF
ncbi:MAG: UDP-N-acetylmuramate dehydrogenase [Clostridia bacterium]|nr:UDP-N-acetylmuramate dehydrogenase [Clostridia bacterium]